jgi:hypothetical protein
MKKPPPMWERLVTSKDEKEVKFSSRACEKALRYFYTILLTTKRNVFECKRCLTEKQSKSYGLSNM